MKENNMFIGFAETPFKKVFKDVQKENKNHKVQLIGAVLRGGYNLEGVVSGRAHIDGSDATDEIIRMVLESKFKDQLKGIFLKGLSVAGFNVLDIEKISKVTGIPVVVCIRKEPDLEKTKSTLEYIGMPEKYSLYEKAGEVQHYINPNEEVIFLQFKGITGKDLREMLRLTCTRSILPEPLRLAKVIAQGLKD